VPVDLRQLASQLDATDAQALRALDRHERRRLADTLRAWAYIANESTRLQTDADATGRVRGAGGRFLKSGVLVALQNGERAP
jgi:hypothetical protein